MSTTYATFRFRVPCHNQADVDLAHFLQQAHHGHEGHTLLWQAMRAFWLPYAYQALDRPPVEVQRAARLAGAILHEHLLMLSLEFHLPLPSPLALPSHPDPRPAVSLTTTAPTAIPDATDPNRTLDALFADI